MSLEQKIAAAVSLLQQIEQQHAPATFATSLGAEDMVLTDLIAKNAPGIEVFTLDTGRLPQETYALLQQVGDRYAGLKVKVYYPERTVIEQYVNDHGINAFYQSVELRKQCCHIRKVEPLKRALAGKTAWITGIRRDQAVTRQGLELQTYDADNGLEKFNPLLEWSHLDVWTYISMNKVPYNLLHDQGYPSIGCQPCTRAISAEEDIRAGRWWWEDPEHKECGLHRRPQIAARAAHGAAAIASERA